MAISADGDRVAVGAFKNDGNGTSSGHVRVFGLAQPTATVTGTILDEDDAPVADVGGPYVIDEGDGLVLDASETTDADAPLLTYRWDVDGDGDFDGTSPGDAPTLTSAVMASLGLADGPDSRTITVEATDSANFVAPAQTTLTINNVAPTVPPTRWP